MKEELIWVDLFGLNYIDIRLLILFLSFENIGLRFGLAHLFIWAS